MVCAESLQKGDRTPSIPQLTWRYCDHPRVHAQLYVGCPIEYHEQREKWFAEWCCLKRSYCNLPDISKWDWWMNATTRCNILSIQRWEFARFPSESDSKECLIRQFRSITRWPRKMWTKWIFILHLQEGPLQSWLVPRLAHICRKRVNFAMTHSVKSLVQAGRWRHSTHCTLWNQHSFLFFRCVFSWKS